MDVRSLYWRDGFVYAGDCRLRTDMIKRTDSARIYQVYAPRLHGGGVVAVVKKIKTSHELEFSIERSMVDIVQASPALSKLFVRAWVMNESSIGMEPYEGDLSELDWKTVDDASILKVVQALARNLETMVAHGLYYTDLKWHNILYSRDGSGGLILKWCDLASIARQGEAWTCQTFPYPNETYDREDYEGTIETPSERVLVWGLGCIWLQLLGKGRLCNELVSHVHMTPRSFRTFKRRVNNLELPHALKSILFLKVPTLGALHSLFNSSIP